jgi:uncharacterized protein (TIGR04255 family)
MGRTSGRAFGDRTQPHYIATPMSGSVLPVFEAPPLVEVALGVQFAPVPALRPIELGPLRDQWRPDYPIVQEVTPLPPQIESEAPGLPTVQFMVGGAPQTRLWFSNEAQSELVQLQQDRLIANWRQTPQDSVYPRYDAVRALFSSRLEDLESFIHNRSLGVLEITQVEVTYINAIDRTNEDQSDLDRILRNWQPLTEHHLGQPEQARAALVFVVPDVGRAPVRMYVAIDPGNRPSGTPATFLTMTVRGAPGDASSEAAMRFMDDAHAHAVNSFAELTSPEIQEEWRRST